MPQSDILAHKNIKLFISHGGMFGLIEGTHRGDFVMNNLTRDLFKKPLSNNHYNSGVPILFLPLYGDQVIFQIP